MSKILQLDFFEEEEITLLKKEFDETKESVHRIRKGLFAKHGALQKKYDELEERLAILERNICLTK